MFYITGLYRQWSDGAGITPPPPPPPVESRQRPAGAPAGRRSKRKRYVVDGQPMLLSPDELEDALATLLAHPPKRIVRAVKAQAKVEAREERAEAESETAQRPIEVPAYTQTPIFDYLQRQSWVQEQSDVLAALHAAAMRVMAEDDEDDVFLIHEIFKL